MLEAKQYGFSDRQLLHIWYTSETEVRRARSEMQVRAVFKLVDTCAAEFEAFTPYYYSTYESPVTTPEAPPSRTRAGRQAKSNASAILGGGPNRIGCGIEFDYCCCQAAYKHVALAKSSWSI